ncbi:MAG: hypothetical protein FWD90_13145 [Defluviitaleaceae bacterium]|nr:hypothetical protein [Defluviitaleaceae bacterium]
MLTVFTNNNVAADFFKVKKELDCTVKWVSAPAMDVLTAARVAVRKGSVLVSNPMIGVNVPAVQAPGKPRFPSQANKVNPTIINPYLTLLTTEPLDTVDFQSLKRLDEALSMYKNNAKLRFIAHSDDSIQHFQAIDLKYMLQTLSMLLKMDLHF